METKNEFKVSEVDGKVQIAQTITKVMEMTEAVTELQKLKQEMQQVVMQKDKLQTYINTEQYNKELAANVENVENLEKLDKEWTAIIAPLLDKLRVTFKDKVAEKKVAEQYGEITDGTKKVLAKNKILTEVCKEMELDAQHPVVQEARRIFDE